MAHIGENTMTTYTVFHSNDSTKATSRLTLEEAAHELMTYDGHDYEIRQDGTFSDGSPILRLYVTQFSRNSTLGGLPMVGTFITGQREQEIWQDVVGLAWRGMEAMTDAQYDQMLADLEQETEE